MPVEEVGRREAEHGGGHEQQLLEPVELFDRHDDVPLYCYLYMHYYFYKLYKQEEVPEELQGL